MQTAQYTDVMIDIETLSSSPRAAIIQIGACMFNLKPDSANNLAIGPRFTMLVRPDLATSEISLETVCWWMEQNEGARMHVAQCAKSGAHPNVALFALSDFIVANSDHNSVEVWAMPPEFDLVILRNAADAASMKLPWHYAASRDLRTLERLAGGSKSDRIKPAIAHDAGYDAEAQAKTAIMYYSRIRRGVDR